MLNKDLSSLLRMERRIHERIHELSGDPEAMYEYMMQCIPHIREYTTERPGGVQRKDIFDAYMSDVENTTMIDTKKTVPTVTKEDTFCPTCNTWYTLVFEPETSEMVCTSCGAVQYVQSSKCNFKEEQETQVRNIVYSYKRDNHFNEWIAQFQAKEMTSIPPDVIEKLRTEFKKQKITDSTDITHRKVRGLLKKLGLNKYYEHAPYITTILNGVKPPTMPQALEERLRLMFYQIQKPFEKHCPSDRKNFLSYSYTLYKFCELLGEDEYLPCFPLLKSKEKLHRQDDIWKLICQDLAWEYIPTAS
jgi:Poxvirus Late Transcription Factor VLTF3 like